MATFQPFSGLRYDVSLVDMDDVIAPPYDVVDDAGRAELAAHSEYNSILVELPADDAQRGVDRYQVAAELLSSWTEKGVLRRDAEPCFYGCRMSYEDAGGRTLETVGVLGELGVRESDRATILPHEETMPKPKGDRLFLLRATRTNISPIWGLSLAPGLTSACRWDRARDSDYVQAVDDEGVTHTLWRISEAAACDAIARAVSSEAVVIADGHHRFETALAYREERGDDPGAAGVMAFVVELAREQLHVRSIHRVVSGLPQGFDVAAALGGRFAPQAFVGDPAALTPELLVEQGAIALVCRESAWLLRDVQTVRGGGKGEDVLAELDSVRLRSALDGLPDHELSYEARWPVALEAVVSGRADAVVMIRPVTVDQIGRAAHAGVRMPPKTTYFHPKPRTGMVFRPLD